MSTLLTELLIVAGAVGPAASTISMEAEKTLIVSGVGGTIDVEASYDGIKFCTVATFAANGKTDAIVKVAAPFMRVDASNGSAATVCVMAESGSVRSSILPNPVGNGPGAALDISLFGALTTVFVTNINGQKTSINIEISCDGITWSQEFKTFTDDGCMTKAISARYIRAVGNKGIATVGVSSQNGAPANSSGPILAYVFRPDATGDDAPGGNVYTDWELLYEALQSTKDNGPRELYFDSRFSTYATVLGEGFNACLIPEGVWDMLDVTWKSFGKSGPETGLAGLTVVTFEDNAFCPRLEDIHFHGVILHDGEVHSPLSSAFTAGLTGTCELVNTNPLAKPLCSLPVDTTGRPIVFNFMDGCQFGASVGPTPTVFNTPAVSIAPVIDCGDNFVFLVGLGCITTDGAFMTGPGGFAGFLGANSAFSGGHSWQQPDCPNGFFAFTITSGNVWPVFEGVRSADFDLWANRMYAANTLLGPINAQAFDANADGQSFTISDWKGNCGLNGVEVLAPPSFGSVEAAYLNRPFQSKTWVSKWGNWKLDKNAYEDFVTDAISAADGAVAAPGFVDTDGITEMTAAPAAPFNSSVIGQSITIVGSTTNDGTFIITGFTANTLLWEGTGGLTEAAAGNYSIDWVAVNNATNIVDSSAVTFELKFPLAAIAKKGSIIRVVSDGSGGLNSADLMAKPGDTIVGAIQVANNQHVAHQSDGVSKWIQISS